MILYGGKIYDSNEQDRLLENLEDRITDTLIHKKLNVENVISAIDGLSKEIAQGKYDDIFETLQIDQVDRYKELAISLLSKENILYKLKTELGEVPEKYKTNPPNNLTPIHVERLPLGVIFHIAAGNADGLPAFSLAEGLLTGNINILKLPQVDNDLSLKIIFRLIELEPSLADFIYVFDTPSSDIAAMRKMAAFADGISIWGGDIAIQAVRQFAPTGVKLIEWGHKLSFAYVTDYLEQELYSLAEHIASTKQFLCSSCQMIYLDSDCMEDVHDFCKKFLPLLEKAISNHQSKIIGERAHFTLIRQTRWLQDVVDDKRNPNEYRGVGCSVIACEDQELVVSPMMCNVLVKRMPHDQLAKELRSKKGYLQTVSVIGLKEKKEPIVHILKSCGVTKIVSPQNMSEFFSGEAHDGSYPLSLYTRIVNMED